MPFTLLAFVVLLLFFRGEIFKIDVWYSIFLFVFIALPDIGGTIYVLKEWRDRRGAIFYHKVYERADDYPDWPDDIAYKGRLYSILSGFFFVVWTPLILYFQLKGTYHAGIFLTNFPKIV